MSLAVLISKNVKGVLSALLTLVILVVAIVALDWRELLAVLQDISLSTLLLCFCLNVITVILLSVRWSILSTATDMLRFDRVKAREMLQFLYAGLFNLVTPGAIGADIYRVVDGTRREGGRVGSVGFVMLERLLGLVSQMLVYCLAIAVFTMGHDNVDIAPPFVLTAIIFGAVICVVLVTCVLLQFVDVPNPRWLGPRAGEMFATLVRAVSLPGRKLAFLAAFSVIPVVTWIFAVQSLTISLPLDVALSAAAMCIILTEFIRLVPSSFQGIGVREGGFALLVTMFGGYAQGAFVVAVVVYVVNMIAIALLAVVASMALRALRD